MLPPYTIDSQQPKPASGNGHGTSSRYGALVPVASSEIVPSGHFAWPSAPSAATLTPSVTAGNILHSLRRRWWIGAGVGVLFAIAFAIASWYLVPNKQEVSALLHISRESEQILDNAHRIVQEPEFEAFKNTQAGFVRQKLNLEAALAQTDPETGLELARNREVQKHPNPIRWLEDNLVVESPERSELLWVTLAGEEPKELVKIVNAICKVYLENVVERERREAKARLDDITNRYQDNEQKLNTATQKLSAVAATSGVADKNNMQHSQAAKVTLYSQQNQHAVELERRLLDISHRLLEAKSDLQVAQTLVVTPGQLEHELLNDKIYQDKKLDLDKLRKAYNEAASKMRTPNHAKLKSLQDMLDEAERDIDDYKEQMRPIIEDHLKGPDRVAKLESEIKYLGEEEAQLKKSLDETRAEIGKLEAELREIATNSPVLEMLTHEIQIMTDNSRELAAAKLKLDLAAGQPPRITQVAEATVPESSKEMFKYMAVGFAAFFGFCLPMVGITFWDFQQHRVNRPHDASSGLGLKILGALPAVGGRKGRQAALPAKSEMPRAGLQRLLADSVDGVRTALLRDNAAEGTRVVLVTSAVHHEGKTTLASQLATSLARAGKRTLLLDGDLRKPVGHRLFGLSLDPGLCEVLRNECELEETIRPTRASGLWMMTAGRCDEEALHDLAKDGVDEIFKQLRTGFDFIVIDSSPVLATADALVIGQYVDAAILSVLRDASRVPTVFEACDRLRGVGIRVLGTVFNGNKQEPSSNGAARRLTKAATL